MKIMSDGLKEKGIAPATNQRSGGNKKKDATNSDADGKRTTERRRRRRIEGRQQRGSSWPLFVDLW